MSAPQNSDTSTDTRANLPMIRLDYTGLAWERWDSFAGEWWPLPLGWSQRDAISLVASIYGCEPRHVRIAARGQGTSRVSS